MNSRQLIVAFALFCCGIASHADTIENGGRVRVFENPASVSEFELLDEEGLLFRFADLRGKSALIFFGFTHCPGVCPATMHKLRLLDKALRDARSQPPALVMISVDGDRDTPAVMKAYLDPLSADFIGLTGDPRTVRRVAEGLSAVFFKGLPADGSSGYLVEHTSQVYLVDSAGRLRATFFDATVELMLQAVQRMSASAN